MVHRPRLVGKGGTCGGVWALITVSVLLTLMHPVLGASWDTFMHYHASRAFKPANILDPATAVETAPALLLWQHALLQAEEAINLGLKLQPQLLNRSLQRGGQLL